MKVQEENLKMIATLGQSLAAGLSSSVRQITGLLDNVPTAAAINEMVKNAVDNAHSASVNGYPNSGTEHRQPGSRSSTSRHQQSREDQYIDHPKRPALLVRVHSQYASTHA
jgi:hypothetical protein